MSKFSLLITSVFFFSFAALAKNNTPDYYKCVAKNSGEWNFGRGGFGCNASSFGSDTFIKSNFSNQIFLDQNRDRTLERERYMQEMHPVIRDAAEYYIKKRKPNVSANEIEAFKLGVMTMANQESFWSHYRKASDDKLKLMRGDYGHGHGLLQVDDRFHFPAVQNGTAWSLIGNITYSLDEFYAAWEMAPNKSCVKSPTNYSARIRSAWAAYNGGPSKLCRWTNPKDTWARNDIGFNQKLNAKAWRNFIKDERKPASINVPCLIEKKNGCKNSSNIEENLKENTLYQNQEGKSCVLKNNVLYCLQDARDALCLQTVSPFQNSIALLASTTTFDKFTIKNLDRHSTCQTYDPSLLKVGGTLQINKPVNLRANISGGVIRLLPKGIRAEILDFEVQDYGKNNRYYKINAQDTDGLVKTGFIYAGSSTTHEEWTQSTTLSASSQSFIAQSGDWIEIKNPSGINLRSTPDGAFIKNLPEGSKLAVLNYVVRGNENFVYYQVKFKGQIGYIYSGSLLPANTIANWTAPSK